MSEPNNLLRFERLHLRNFRCFADCPLELHPDLTILVAENGGGKTALLDGLRLALGVFVTTVGGTKLARGFEATDIHRLWRVEESKIVQRLPVEFDATAIVNGEQVHWSRCLQSNSRRARNSTKGLLGIQMAAERVGAKLSDSDARPSEELPVVAYYGTGRLWDQHRLRAEKQWAAANTPARFSAYLDCLSPSASYKAFTSWFEQTMEQVADPSSRVLGFQARPENAIVAVREAVQTVLQPTGWSTIDWHFALHDDEWRAYQRGFMVAENQNRLRLPLEQLSDGIRNMVALVADIAHRCVRLNPHLGEAAAQRTPGIVMIDEVDMHLHPAWQQLTVGLLRTAFPRVQFILSTHSPHVLTTVRKENIRVITADEAGHWRTPAPERSPLGQESGDALAFIMNAHPRPSLPLLDDVHAFEQMARAGHSESPEARAILERLQNDGFEFTDAQTALFNSLARRTRNTTPESNG